ncbi:MAG TPA: ribulose-phosphate 3-epimerase [Lachnospiraceae bacterium]|nr:ribulose-phosphate 3-epimerase [Lachnospiraceae bacterium]
MIILAPSILSADFAELGSNIKRAEEAGADYIHFDVMDGMFVPNISFGLPVLRSVRKVTDLTLDVHLMIEEPARFLKNFKEAGADIITVHAEACSDLIGTVRQIRDLGMQAGVSVKPDTDISCLRPLYGKVRMFLVMTVEPGFGGQKLIPACVDKVKKLRRELSGLELRTDIEVDGGVTKENVRVILDAGANVIVMGSSVFKGDIAENVRYFKGLFKEYE